MPGTLVTRIDFAGGRRFEVVIYDLLAEPTEAIVNAANGGLSHGGGVAAAISKAAGAALDDEGNRIVRERGRIPVGEAVVTTAGQLPFKGVIHAVGPRLGDGKEGERIVQALKAAFLRAHERGWASVSSPGISAGIFAVPPEVCARAYLQAVRGFFAEFPKFVGRLDPPGALPGTPSGGGETRNATLIRLGGSESATSTRWSGRPDWTRRLSQLGTLSPFPWPTGSNTIPWPVGQQFSSAGLICRALSPGCRPPPSLGTADKPIFVRRK